MNIREPAASGRLYPKNKYNLEKIVKELRKKEKSRINYKLASRPIIGGVVPHGGYEFSGYEAIHFFEILRKSKQRFDTIVILSPNHDGLGNDICLDTNEIWANPLGDVYLDLEFQQNLGFEYDDTAQKTEHSCEVMLPFLQVLYPFKYKIVPISIRKQNISNARKIAAALFETAMMLNRRILIIASTDFSHFVSPEEGIVKDNLALEQINALNADELEEVVKEHKISMCGYGPIMCLIEYAHIVANEPKFELLSRGNSFKRYQSVEVVDYISGLMFENMPA